jgi:hypothetical protein
MYNNQSVQYYAAVIAAMQIMMSLEMVFDDGLT